MQSNLGSQKVFMTNMHTHRDICVKETKFPTMDIKIIFPIALHYGSNICLCGATMKLCLRWFETLKKSSNSPGKQNPNVLNFKP